MRKNRRAEGMGGWQKQGNWGNLPSGKGREKSQENRGRWGAYLRAMDVAVPRRR